MATVSAVKELVRLCREASVTLFIWGAHGVGKSSLVRQVAEVQEIGFVDLRCAQLESCDLRGFPDKGSDGRTHFLPPAELPTGGDGILFLDELNRAGSDVLAAAFQLVLDRAAGEYRLPDGWSIVCAGNFSREQYTITEMDAALLDRFCHVTVSSGEATFDEWVKWLSGEHGPAAQDVVEFCSENLKHLEQPTDDAQAPTVLPSRRSWDRALRCLSVWGRGGYSQDARLETLAGLVGRPLAISYLKRRRAPVRPSDLLRGGVAAQRKKLAKLSRPQLQAVMWGLVGHVRQQINQTDVTEVLLDFAEFLSESDRDLAFAFCTALLEHDWMVGDEDPEVRGALLTNTPLGAGLAQIHKNDGKSLGIYGRLLTRPKLTSVFSSIYVAAPSGHNGEVNSCSTIN